MPSGYNEDLKALSRQSILQAFVELIGTKRTTIVSITELCRRAGTSRMAFYRNFNNIQDVLQYYLAEWKWELLQTFEGYADKSWRGLGLLFMTSAENDRSVFQAIFNDGLTSLLTDFIISGIELFNTSLYERRYDSILKARYAARFEAGGMIAVLSEWFSRDCSDSKEDIILLILEKAGVPAEM